MKKTFTKQFEWVMGMTGSTSCFSPTRRLLLLLCLILVGVGGAKAQSDVTFNEGVRYSQWVIDSRLGDFYGNTNDFGFTTYNRDLSVKKEVTKWKDGSVSPYIDYVPGLVAKATIEAADYYKTFTWAKPWFKSVEWYGNKCTVPTSPDNLDAINASKMYFGIYSLTNSTDGAFKSDDGASTTASKATTELGNALTALKSYSTNYAFPTSTTLNGNNITGGWYHKSSYSKQMWLDGQYMGPALLAQLINGYSSYSSNKVSDNDWELVTKQFIIVWEQCWDDKEELLYHAFSLEALNYWTSDAEIWTTAQTDKTKWTSMTAAGHSAAFWGRAEGWYFLALVDVLEQMQIAGLDKESVSNHSYYTTLKGFLDKLATGIKARQDETSGCWYQLVGKDGSYTASYYNGNAANLKSNYLESSCTAIFAAAYLKAIRLGLLDKTTYEDTALKAYKGAVERFMKQRADGTVDLLGCCKSAGVGTAALGDDKFRDGSNAYYLHGYDVTPTSTNSDDYYTEGKVMGAFIMAATEYERANEKAIRFSYDLAPAYTLTQGDALTVEALGSGAESATYQWYKSDGTTSTAVTDAKTATFAPTESGSYYCQATTSDNETTIKTSTAAVTVSEAPTEATSPVVWTFTSSTIDGTLGTEGNSVTFTSSDGSETVMTYVSGNSDAITTSSQTINGVAYSSYLKENGSGSATGNRRMEFEAPSSKGTVTVVYAATAGSTKIVDGSNGNAELASLTGTANKAVTSSEISTTFGNKIIIFCPNKSYIYSVIWTPTESTSGGGTTEYTVTLNATDVTGYPQNMTYSGTALVLPTPEKTGYTFDGWYTAETGGTKVDSPYTPTENVTLYAHYTATSAGTSPSATFDWTSSGNTTTNPTTIKGITVSGTKRDSGGFLQVDKGCDLTITPPTGVTITKLVITYTTDGKQIDDDNLSYNATNMQSSWTGSSSSAITFTHSSSAGAAARIKTIEVTYTTGTSTGYTITYDMKGHGTQEEEVTDAPALPETLPTPEEEGYTFGGWYTDSDLTQVATAGATISEDITLYAKWTINKYTVTANAENGTVTISDGTNTIQSGTEVDHGTSLTFTATAADGYEFSSWTVTGTTGTESGSTYTISSLTAATTVTANFTATSSGGGAVSEVIYFTSGTTSSNEDVLKVIKGSQKTGSSVTYNGTTYSNGVKMESSTDISLTLTAESDVTFVFDTANKDFKVGETTYTTGSDGTCKITLQPGTYSIKKVDTSVALYAVDIKSTGPSISFTTQPEDAEYLRGATSVTPLTVVAQVNNVTGEASAISYKWYRNTENSTESGTVITGETNASYTPDVTTDGTTYYYCKATATVGDEELSANSTIAIVTVSEASLTIVTQPVDATYALNQTGVEPLIVVAKTNTSETITYQWYRNSSNSTEGATEITGQTSSEYTPAVTALGTTYYYCEVKAGTLTATTNIVVIAVNKEQPTYGYKVSKSGLSAPGINTSMYITTTSDGTGATGDKLVKMTFGGWKWSDGKYVKPNSETQITDSWKNSDTESGVTILDGYNYWFLGTQDAVQEDKTAETEMYGHTRYGWFVSPTRDANGVTTESHPYTLPVRGSFMTFEPTMNGTLTIYILQNGAWNTFDKATTLDGVSYATGDIKPGEFRMHAFQITNQRGLVLEEFAPTYSITTNQKVADGYSCTKYEDKDKPETFDKTSKDISQWEEFWALSTKERQAVHDNWSVESNNGCQEIIKLDNGSFLAIQKAIVKYEFHVTGNETYYMFSNFSKMGFSGATFQPDETQPTDETTFSGDNSLSDTKEFTKITATATENKISGTEMTEYKFMIGENEVGKVDGVFIPQFKNITLNRTFTANQWTTLTLPFNLTQTEVQEIFGSGTQLIQLDNATVDNGCARLEFVYHEIQNVLPGYPYLIKPTQTLSTFTVSNKCINPMIDQTNINCGAYTFKGVPGYSKPGSTSISGKDAYSVNFKENDIFVSDGNGQMYVSAGSSYGKGYRAWFEKKTDDTSTSGKINSISLVIDNPGDDDDNVVTTIDMVDVDPDVFNALGVATGVYNLNGQKVSDDMRSLPKGIYIVNGKKIVRK